MTEMSSALNHWSFAFPSFFNTLELDIMDEEFATEMFNPKLPYGFGIWRNEHGAEVKSINELAVPVSWIVTEHKKTEINGLDAVYYQAHTRNQYLRGAFILYNERARIHYWLCIGTPKEEKSKFDELMDAFIYSLKLDDEKINARYGEKLAAKIEAIEYTESLISKFGNAPQGLLLANSSGKDLYKRAAKSIHNDFLDSLANDEYPIMTFITKKAIYINPSQFKVNFLKIPWPSITNVKEKKSLLGNKVIFELEADGEIITKEMRTDKIILHNYIFEVIKQMWKDFAN